MFLVIEFVCKALPSRQKKTIANAAAAARAAAWPIVLELYALISVRDVDDKDRQLRLLRRKAHERGGGAEREWA